MLLVTRVGCYVAMIHGENEAEHQHYEGLHGWNFSVKDGRFVIRRGRGNDAGIDVANELGAAAEVACSSEDNLVFVAMRKR